MTQLTISENDLIAIFTSPKNWQERYRQLIKLASLLPGFAAQGKTDNLAQYHIGGCENNVWLKVTKQANNTFAFNGDSDGRIVKGLLCILVILTQGKTARQILDTDFNAIFKQLKLSTELSESRLTGLQKLTAHLVSQVNKQK